MHSFSPASTIPIPTHHPKVTGREMTFPNLFFAQGSEKRYLTQNFSKAIP